MQHKVLDKGFIEVVDKMGKDLSNPSLKVVNAARVSMGKRKEEFDEKDQKLMDYLASQEPIHSAPFRHLYLTFHVKAPEVVARQWYKHIIGSDYEFGTFKDQPWNEISGRYVVYDNEFYIPNVFRRQSKSNKQASDGVFSQQDNAQIQEEYINLISACEKQYNKFIAMGMAKEQARMLLPFCLYTEWYWTASLQAVAHFCKLRNHSHAQWEIQEYALVVDELMRKEYPNAYTTLIEHL